MQLKVCGDLFKRVLTGRADCATTPAARVTQDTARIERVKVDRMQPGASCVGEDSVFEQSGAECISRGFKSTMKKQTGILLTQLGTPKAATVGAVRPYLRQFLNDPRVIDIPALVRLVLVNLVIVPFRAPKSTKIYKELWEYGNGRSPLLTITKALTEIRYAQRRDIFVHMAMRHPSRPWTQSSSRCNAKTMTRSSSRLCFIMHRLVLVQPFNGRWTSSRSGGSFRNSKLSAILRCRVVDTLVEQAQKHDLDSYDHIIMSYHGLPDRHVDKVYLDKADLCTT